jgi:hypothetical protein
MDVFTSMIITAQKEKVIIEDCAVQWAAPVCTYYIVGGRFNGK